MDTDTEESSRKMADVETSSEKLPCDIYRIVAHSYLQNPVDVFNLGRTCRDHWRLLRDEVYETEVDRKWERDELHCLTEPKWRPLTILQWAAVAGNEAVAENVTTVAGRVWPEDVFLKHLDSLNSALHFAAWYGNAGILKLLSQVRINGQLPDMNSLAGITFKVRLTSDSQHHVYDVFRYINPSMGCFPQGGTGGWTDRSFSPECSEHCDPPRRLRTDLDFDPVVHPLHLACFMGMEKVVAAILAKGADSNNKADNLEGSMPLMWAVTRPNTDTVMDCLLGHGAEIMLVDELGRDALAWAVLCKSHEKALRLVKAGARADFAFDRNLLGDEGEPYKGCTLGLCMEDDAYLPCTKLILQRFPDFPEGLMRNCVNHAFGDVAKNRETIRWLIDQGIGLDPIQEGEFEPQERWYIPPKMEGLGMSPIHHIAGSDALPLDLLSKLLDKRPQDINLVSVPTGHTPLSVALKLGYESEKVAFLLAHGADPAACTVDNGRNILVAVKKGLRASTIKDIEGRLNADQFQRLKPGWRTRFLRQEKWAITKKQLKQLWDLDVIFWQACTLIDSHGLSIRDVIELHQSGKDVKAELERLNAEKEKKASLGVEDFRRVYTRKRERRRRKSLRRHRLGLFDIPRRRRTISSYLHFPE
ncbi:uncharacterized protein PG986_014215 [Apiospora aurea]|uniref:Ankyrin n=1 Tax=Apiospora aurea TaxID=335848 RepID=A0ABR1PSM7_9PEZI